MNCLDVTKCNWQIWPETDGQTQKCLTCGLFRDTIVVTNKFVPPTQCEMMRMCSDEQRCIRHCVVAGPTFAPNVIVHHKPTNTNREVETHTTDPRGGRWYWFTGQTREEGWTHEYEVEEAH